MQTILTIAERHGTLIVFLNVLLSQGGLPLPVLPTLMTVAALARQSPYQITQIILAGVSGALIAEFTRSRASLATLMSSATGTAGGSRAGRITRRSWMRS